MHFFPAARLLWRGFFVYLCAMKQMLTIGFLWVLMALAACNPSAEVAEHGRNEEGPNPELSAIDSLMWRQPDSALAVLQHFAGSPQADNLDKLNGHYCQLLISELLYKNDYGQSNRPALQQAVRYFDSLCLCKGVARNISTIAFLDARAHYINGVGYYERDSVVEACKEYLKALEVMENSFEEDELKGEKAQFMALTHTRLTILFSDLYLHEQTICFGLLALGYYKKFASPRWHIAWMLNKVGSQYDMMDNNDSAKMLYMEALQILPDTNNITYRDIATRLAYLSYKMGESPEKSLKQLHTIIAQAENEKEFYSRCMNIGEIFYHESQFDSAAFYLSKVFHESQNVNSKKQAAEWLVEICKTQGKDSEAHEYADFLVPFATQDENNSMIKSQLAELYNTHKQQELVRQHHKETSKQVNRTLAVVAGMLFVILTISLLNHKNRRHKQYLETLIETERNTHKIQQSALSNRLKRSNEELRELKDQIRQQTDSMNTKQETQALSFNDEPICRLIMERVNDGQFKAQMDCMNYKDYALGKDDLVALREAANRHFNQFTIRLAKAYPALTQGDLDYCCLYLLGLSDADVSALMQRAYNTVNERNSKLRRVLGSENAISFTLQAIANESVSI